MAEKYDHKAMEKKWQDKWEKENTFRAEEDSSKPKQYILDMFPYPSGDGLHVGHVEGYTATDIYSRYKRMRGFNVLHPMGWDSFGLPAENFAIKTGVPPQETTDKSINNFRKQIKALGLSYDWAREVGAHNPDYYRWTQWIFTKFFEKGLVYKKKALVNWDPVDQTVLANEQVLPDGTAERSGAKVEKRDLEQWFFKITDYADELADSLDQVDWPESTKINQRNWIGRSEGAEITFKLNCPTPAMDLVFATNNAGKLKRMQRLFKEVGLPITLKTPKDIGIENFDVVENGKTLAENSEKKARALSALTDLPVFSDDSGFFIDNEMIDPVTVKRNALAGVDEAALTVEEIALKMQNYYAGIAAGRGGRVDAQWRNNLCFVTPEKAALHVETIRPVILTSESRGAVDPYLPLRGLYISKATDKYVLEQTEEEELLELKPITEGILKLFTPSINVFTTRPDTLFGATYLVLAPEHPLVNELAEKIQNMNEVFVYAEKAKNKSDIERGAEGKEKTGVELKGIKAVNPANKEEIPIYIADYVLGHYGTGAIMAVPAHDQRDFEFAQKFGLPIKQVVVPCATDTINPPREGLDEVKRDTVIVHLRDKSTGKFALLDWHGSLEGITTAIMGGIEPGQTPEQAALAEIHEEAGLEAKIVGSAKWITAARYCASHKNQNRCAHAWGLLAEVDSLETQKPVSKNEQALHTLVWVAEDEVEQKLVPAHQKQVWHLLHHDNATTDAGYLIDSGQFDGMDSEEAKKKITEFVGGQIKKTYRLRDWLISRQRYWGAPIPIVYDPEGKPHAVPEEHLPWMLPTDVEFKPTGTSPLGQSKEFAERTERLFGKGWRPEVDTMDTFACSSWYFFRFADPKNEKEFAGKEAMQKWLPVDLYVGGAEHTVLHLLYARFFTKALRDMGYIAFGEPFLKLRHQGIILAEDSRKMSKRWGNVINPDDMAERFGADALRMYEMFMGPLEAMKPWSTKNIAGLERFLERVWRLNEKIGESPLQSSFASLLNQTIKKVGDDIESLKMNTAVSALMILLNELEKSPSREAYKIFLQLLSPFAPHLASELWEKLGEKTTIYRSLWPQFDASKLVAETVTIAVQVNGRVRASIELSPNATEGEALTAARGAVGGWITGPEKRVVYVPGKIVNIVV